MEQQTNTYTFEIMTTDGVLRQSFSGDISTSSFVYNYVKDMFITDNHIELVSIGDRNMAAHDCDLFYAIWQYLSSTPVGIEFAKNINPDFFEDKGADPSEFLPEELYILLKPTTKDIIMHKEWLANASTVSMTDMDSNTNTISLLKMRPFLQLVNCINYANFLGIESIIQLLAKLIAEYTKVFIKIRRI